LHENLGTNIPTGRYCDVGAWRFLIIDDSTNRYGNIVLSEMEGEILNLLMEVFSYISMIIDGLDPYIKGNEKVFCSGFVESFFSSYLSSKYNFDKDYQKFMSMTVTCSRLRLFMITA
jgi:hypothetical protein